MFRTAHMKAMDRAYEAQRLNEAMSRLRAKQKDTEYHDNKTISLCVQTAMELQKEYKEGAELNKSMIHLVLETLQFVSDDITVVSFSEITYLYYLFLERLSFPGSDDPFIVTVGGLYFSLFGRPFLSATPQNVEILRQEDDDTVTPIGILGNNLLSILRDAKEQMPEEKDKKGFYFEITRLLEDKIKESKVPYATWNYVKIFG